VPERDLYIECLLNAKAMDEVEYFYYQMKHNKCRPLKECSNIANAEVIRVNNNFYYKIK
jgi:pentatricopeptide repeat protein